LVQPAAELSFAFQPSIDQRQVKELADLSFAHDAANVALLSRQDVGQDAPGSGPQGN
jgi:hypothetical protein